MPIRIFIQDDGGFTPEEAGYLILAFEYTLRQIRCVNRTDKIAILLARQIITVARSGERDPLILSAKALAALGLKPTEMAQSRRAAW